MSSLNNVRTVFNGRFQADVSTVNNDVRHFDNSTFEASFQEFQSNREVWNGWWNPPGSGAFRFLGCRVVAGALPRWHIGDLRSSLGNEYRRIGRPD
jgi:hypothetical protein